MQRVNHPDADRAHGCDADFELIGSSNQTVKPFDKTVSQPEEGQYRQLRALLQQGDSITASLAFYLPSAEANLVMVWSPFGSDRVYFEMKQNNRRFGVE